MTSHPYVAELMLMKEEHMALEWNKLCYYQITHQEKIDAVDQMYSVLSDALREWKSSKKDI